MNTVGKWIAIISFVGGGIWWAASLEAENEHTREIIEIKFSHILEKIDAIEKSIDAINRKME